MSASRRAIFLLAIGALVVGGAAIVADRVARYPPRPSLIESLPPSTRVARIGEVAPDFELSDLHGARHKLSDWRGHTLMLNFWASWCSGCIEEMPMLEALQHELSSKGFRLVSVGVDDAESVGFVVSRIHPTYQVLLADHVEVEPSSRFGNRDPLVLPYSVLIGSDGRILKTLRGGYSRKEAWVEWIVAP